MKLEELSNEQLLSGLHGLIGQGRTLLARLLAYLGEVEERRLDLESACSSLADTGDELSADAGPMVVAIAVTSMNCLQVVIFPSPL